MRLYPLGLICGKLCHRNVTAEHGVYFRVNEKMLTTPRLEPGQWG